jgi:hypothetical protein
MIRDTRGAVAQAVGALQPRVDADVDWVPSLSIGWYQCIAVPSLYGADPVYPSGSEPIVEPCFRSVDEAAAAGTPPVRETAVIAEMLRVIDDATASLPEGWGLGFPPVASPFDLAQLMVPGEEFLVAAVTEPALTLEFLLHLADVCIAVIDMVKQRTGDAADFCITNRGIPFPGLRQACDAIVNFSPDMLRQFVLPVLERLAQRYGSLCIHYCTSPAPSMHVLPVLLESPCVTAVDNWQGPDVFIGEDAPARMQDRVAVITDVPLRGPEDMRAFLDREPVRDVPRRGGRGLVVQTTADSVDHARELYATWRELTG